MMMNQIKKSVSGWLKCLKYQQFNIVPLGAVGDAALEVVSRADVAGLHGGVLGGVDGRQSLEDGVVGGRRVDGGEGGWVPRVVERIRGHHGSSVLKYSGCLVMYFSANPGYTSHF